MPRPVLITNTVLKKKFKCLSYDDLIVVDSFMTYYRLALNTCLVFVSTHT
jgi:hypothetical protein